MSIDTNFKISRTIRALWYFTLLLLVYLSLQPVANRTTRISLAVLVLGTLATILMYLWPRKRVRVGFLAVFTAVIGLLVIPWTPHTAPKILRGRYVQQLQSYENSPYYWGGESRGGIDCSGLIRRAMIDTCFCEGFSNADIGLIRHGLSLWWNDTSAAALGQEHQGLTQRLFSNPDLKSLDHSKILPGDIAVTADGVHIMAYIGSDTWIEADPGELQVIKVEAPTTTNGWFLHPVNMLRWSLLR